MFIQNKESLYNSSTLNSSTLNNSTLNQSFLNVDQKSTLQNPSSFLFNQLNRIIRFINKSKYDLQSEDLEDLLTDNDFLPDALINELENLKNQNANGKTIVQMLRGIFLGKFLLIGLIKCISVLFLFTLPVILNKLTDQVRDLSKGSPNQQNILYYSLMLITFTVLQAITDTQYSFQINKLEIKTKVFLLDTLYHSAMSRKSTCQDPKQQRSDLMTLFTIDVNTILNFFISFHESWSLILKLIIGITLLYIQMQSAVLVGMGTAIFLMIVNFSVARKIGDYYSRYMVYKDQRMELFREFVSYPKQIKYLKWENIWFNKILKIRQKEFEVTSSYKWLDSLCVLFWSITNTVISTVTLYYYVDVIGQNDLQDYNMFTMIYLFSLLTSPLNSLPWTISGMLQAKTSFKRINSYLSQASTFNQFSEQLKEDILYVETQQLIIPQSKHIWPNQKQNQETEKNQSKDKIHAQEGIQSLNNSMPQKEFILSIPKLTLQKGRIYIVAGPTGAGKSSFIQALLGQMEQVEGQLLEKRQYAYVPQSHWIVQSSIRNNITMNTEINDFEHYLRCIDDCELAEDIMQYKELDFFDVGPEGSKLSGGQKQRLSLCRAIYTKHDIFLLDDIFSSLDPQVADTVFDKAIDNLVSHGKICVLVLNDVQLIRYIDRADVILLVQDGTVVQDQAKLDEYVNNINVDKKKQNKVFKEKSLIKNLRKTLQKVEPQPEQILKDNAKNTKKSISFYLEQVGVMNCSIIIVSLILMQCSFNFYDSWLNSYLNKNPIFLVNDNFIGTLLTLTAIDIFVKIIRATSFAYGNLVQAAKIFQQLLKRVIFGQAGFFDKEDSGQILSRLSGDQNVVDSNFPFELNILCNNIVNFVGTFIILIYMKWILIFPTLISIYFFYQLQQKYRPTSLPLRRLDSQTAALLITQMDDQQKGAAVIVALNASKIQFGLFTKALTNNIRVTWTSKSVSLWLQIRLQAVAGFMVLCILSITIIASYYPNMGFNIDPSTLQLLLYYALTKISLFRDLTLSLTTCEQELISYERIKKYMNYKEEHLLSSQQLQAVVPQQQSIIMENVWLDYQDQPGLYYQPSQIVTNVDNSALRGINIEIRPGEMVAFCGRTGSGKTSILSLIFQLYQENSGGIYKKRELNDSSSDHQKISLFQNDSDFRLSQWRQDISVIPQNGFVFKGTVIENLIPEPNEATMDTLNKLMKELPTDLNLEQDLETGGKNISQGKRQVISFLRVLLENSNIICLDEATASVDQNIEDWTLRTLEILCRLRKKTVITISHRLESLKNYDTIFYVEDGIIKERGTFDELTSDRESGFSKLRNIQENI